MNAPPDVAIVTNNSSPGVNVMITEKLVPAATVKGVGNQDTGNGYANSFGTVYPIFSSLTNQFEEYQ